MKAFTLYTKEEIELRRLLRKLQDYGTINCDFKTFEQIYIRWHAKTFPGCKISVQSVNFRDDWFREFVEFLANEEIN